MKYLQTIFALTIVYVMASCSNGKLDEKGFQVGSSSDNSENNQSNGLNSDSLKIDTRPSSVLLTGVPNVRLTTIYKVNVNKEDNSTFIGSNNFHYRYEETEENKGNNWNNNLMPGLQAVYGYNLVNISHYDIKENKQKNFFEKPVLVKTLYYPTFTKDTLNFKPITRDFFLVSVYNDDTNKDGFINLKDLRRLYLFDINGEQQKALIPENYSVFKSEYDSDNDFMFVFAKLDSNKNGRQDDEEPIHIFWIDLKDPSKTGRQY
ncbi:hypothetical protein [Flavobacterium filum]|uniref:hypothetical protein n=1 Tax=Flavobacterium TaxID=237 RepID=UPI00040AD927|nr:hypothetical protein [Flavobacterium filum]